MKRITFYTPAYLMSRCVIDDDDCWIWQGAKNPDGYGLVRPNQTGSAGVHRVMYILTFGMIPEGLVLHHKCFKRACVNPNHLEIVTNLENIRRGPDHYAVQTECVHGHPYVEGSWFRDTRGSRVCKECYEVMKKITYFRQKIQRAERRSLRGKVDLDALFNTSDGKEDN